MQRNAQHREEVIPSQDAPQTAAGNIVAGIQPNADEPRDSQIHAAASPKDAVIDTVHL